MSEYLGLKWNVDSKRLYETGVKNVALFVKGSSGYGAGVAWEGVTAITESPSGAEATNLYAGDTKYGELMSNEEFGATIEAYTYPDEFAECDGSAELVAGSGVFLGQQTRSAFGLAYITTIGNDEEGNKFGQKLHIVYNAKAKPSERAYATINDSPEAITFSWELTTTPVSFGEEFNPTAHLEIKDTSANFKTIYDKVFGTASTAAALPTPEELIALISAD